MGAMCIMQTPIGGKTMQTCRKIGQQMCGAVAAMVLAVGGALAQSPAATFKPAHMDKLLADVSAARIEARIEACIEVGGKGRG